MSTITFNSPRAGSVRSPAAFTIPQAVKLRAVLPALAARVFKVLSGAALAAVPFAALGWMFIAR